MKKIIKKYFPKPITSAMIYFYYSLRDIIDLLMGRRDKNIPPTRLMFDGPRKISAFKRNGEEYFQYYIKLCGLKPDEKILDVGSGMGRKAIPLTKYLNDNGRYEGVEISRVGIDWCKKKISAKYPNFNFQLIDVFNKRYNPKGKIRASEYRFPFIDQSFDFVVLGSVFTHMLPEDMENYFSEVVRVLKRDRKCLISFFLLNQESLEMMDAKKSTVDFKYEMGKYRSVDAKNPEDALAYDESFIKGLYDKFRLKIIEPIHYGSWCGRQKFLSEQDIVIAENRFW